LQGTRDEHGRLKLSSRRLLVILEKLPDTSEFKTWAVREGDWPVVLKMAAETHKVVAKHYSAFLQSKGVEGEDVMFVPFESPIEAKERYDEFMADAAEFGDQSLDDMYGNLFGN
jgi:hypothetical protein